MTGEADGVSPDARHVARAVVLAALVVFAGCSALPGGGETDTATGTAQVVVTGGDISFDVQRTYARMARMHGEDLRGGTTFAYPVSNTTSGGSGYHPTNFERLWGVRERAPNATLGRHAARAPMPLDRLDAVCERKRWVAHDLAANIQASYVDHTGFPSSVDAWTAERAVRRGAAAYAADRYLAAHTDCPVADRTWSERRANLSLTGALVVARYHFGQRYVAGRVDSPEGVEPLVGNPPLTTEQVIHGYGYDEERPRDLHVETATAGGWSVDNDFGAIWGDRTDPKPQRMGELFVRVLLEEELDYDRAATAAAGWGNDRVVRFARDGQVGYAWALRWDSEADADEFEAAMRDYLAAAGERTAEGWRLNGTAFDVRRVSAETVAVVVGPSSFVAGTDVTGSGGEVAVEADSDGARLHELPDGHVQRVEFEDGRDADVRYQVDALLEIGL